MWGSQELGGEVTARNEVSMFPLDGVEWGALWLKRRHKDTWEGRPRWYWYAMLLEEVIELGVGLLRRDKANIYLELKQIASIAMNFAERFAR